MSEREPGGVSAADDGRPRASDRDRDRVAAPLNTAYAEGRLSREEYDERLGQAMRARTFTDLVELSQDLVAPSVPTPASGVEEYRIEQTAQPQERETVMAVFVGVRRTGQWLVRCRLRAVAVFGGVDLDLRQATFAGDVVEISGFWCFGGLDLSVHAGMRVVDRTASIFGGTGIRYVGKPRPSAPTLVITGVSLFGGVAVRGPDRDSPAR